VRSRAIFVLRLAPLPVLGREEDREVLTEDLLGRVALEAGRPLVPQGDAGVGVEHEDRVVRDVLHEQAEPVLRREHPVGGTVVPGEGLNDGDGPDDRPGGVPDGVDADEDADPGAVRPLDDPLAADDRGAGGQHVGRRGRVGPQEGAVRPVGPPRPERRPVRVVGRRLAAPQFDGPAIVVGEGAVAVAGVDCGGD
jgi:hypothetical protein